MIKSKKDMNLLKMSSLCQTAGKYDNRKYELLCAKGETITIQQYYYIVNHH